MNGAVEHIQSQIGSVNAKIAELAAMRDSIDDADMKALAEEDIKSLENERSMLEEAISSMQSQTSEKTKSGKPTYTDTCLLEIRAGTGGDEAGLFANDLLNMYVRYAELKKWKVEIISKNEGGIGNIKEVGVEITGSRPTTPYEAFQYEMGVHRVQRVPATEASGRIHTSAATVAVLPIVKNLNITIRPEDLKIDTYRAGGAGGQHVNKTESAIRITHVPTGLVVQCQDERSQHKNRARAMSVLESKLADLMNRQQKQSIDELRADQVGTGDRSEKIKTYNYPQDRVTDHRIKKSWFGMERIMSGEIDHILKETKDMMENPDKIAGDDIDEE